MYPSFNGFVLAEKGKKEIAACLSNKKAALLQSYGLLTVGQTIEAAMFRFIRSKKICHAQLVADTAAGRRDCETVKIADADAVFTHQTIGTPETECFSAKSLFDFIEKECSAEYFYRN